MLRAHVHLIAEEYDAALRLYRETLGIRERMNNASGMVAAPLSLARLLVDLDRTAAAKSHLDQALALVPRADSHYEGLGLIGMAAEWAAATGHPQVALLLHAARNKHFIQGGFSMGAMPRGAAERIERARLALSSDLAEQLSNAGGALSYEQSLQRVQAFLGEHQ